MFWRKIMSGWRKVFPIHWMKILANLILFSNWIKIKDGSVLVRRMKILAKLRLFSYRIGNEWYYRWTCFCKGGCNINLWDRLCITGGGKTFFSPTWGGVRDFFYLPEGGSSIFYPHYLLNTQHVQPYFIVKIMTNFAKFRASRILLYNWLIHVTYNNIMTCLN